MIYIKKIYILFLLLVVVETIQSKVVIQPKFASLTAKGMPIKVTELSSSSSVRFEGSSQLIIDKSGWVSNQNTFDKKNCKAWVVAVDPISGETDTCNISIVPWIANMSSLKITQVSTGYQIIGKSSDTLIVYHNNYLYKTEGDLQSLTPFAQFSLENSFNLWGYLHTPSGSFIRNDKDIFFSKDEKKWNKDFQTIGHNLRNEFSYKYDTISQITRVFTADYLSSGEDTARCSVYRKTVSPSVTIEWEKIFTLYSQREWATNKSMFPACRHIHTLVEDPYTGHIWIGTGDDAQMSHIFYSDDNGTTWRHIGMGSQEWRVLSIWFTQKYIYWSMDSPEPQKIFRISRSVYDFKGYWPDMTPKLTSGYIKKGISYMIASLKDYKYIFYGGKIASVGDIIWGAANVNFPINEDNTVFSLNDPTLDYRELVITLPNSAIWGNITVLDDKGDKITLISTDCEGEIIDKNSRIFGVKERLDGSVDIQEVFVSNAGISSMSRFYLCPQDSKGNIYLQPNLMNSNLYKWNDVIKTNINWHDNSLSKGGEVIEKNALTKLTQRKLKLINYDGTILGWQQANSSFDWKKIQVGDSIVNDTISVNGEPGRTKYIRAIVQKEGSSAVASKYIKIELKGNDSEEIAINNPLQSAVRCFPNPVTSDILNIQLVKDSIGKCNVGILSILGQTKIHTINDFDLNPNIELYLSDLPLGVFVLKIDNSEGSYVQKIVKK